MKKHKMGTPFMGSVDQRQHAYVAGQDFEMKRDQFNDFGVEFNYKQLAVRHSSTGMEWGYLGSGCADNALNILLNYISDGTGLVTEDESIWIDTLYQKFKALHVAPVDRMGGIIKYEDVGKFLQTYGLEKAA